MRESIQLLTLPHTFSLRLLKTGTPYALTLPTLPPVQTVNTATINTKIPATQQPIL